MFGVKACMTQLTLWVCAFVIGSTIAFSNHALSRQSVSTTSLCMSDDPTQSDEFSKLMNKRKQIQEQRKAAAAGSDKPKTEDEMVQEYENTSELVSWQDLDKMPELKTKRPVRRAQPKEESSSKKQQESKGNDNNAIDFLSEYKDENELHIPNRMGFSTVSWGEPKLGFVGEGKLTKRMQRDGMFVPGDLQVAYNKLMDAGVSFVQTSENHGKSSRSSNLSAHHILARCLEENDDYTPIVADTFSSKPFQDGVRYGGKAVLKALEASCSRMGTSSLELYQVQSSWLYPGGKRSLADGLALAMDRGFCNYVGVTNVGKTGLKSFSRKLERRGIQLTSNQFDFSLTNRDAFKSGLIDACKDLGVIPLVSDPLDGGLATGKYTATNPSGGDASGSQKYKFAVLEKLQELHSVQETVAEKASNRVRQEVRDLSDRYKSRYGPPPNINTEITTTQVAINYVIAKGCVPLLDITNTKKAEEALGCLGWGLSEEEEDMLDAAASLCGR